VHPVSPARARTELHERIELGIAAEQGLAFGGSSTRRISARSLSGISTGRVSTTFSEKRMLRSFNSMRNSQRGA